MKLKLKLPPCTSFKIEKVFKRKKPRRGFSKDTVESIEDKTIKE